jgi:Zn-dependent peptidase ImmA (M78 family)/transcriptional regulator with XRE-family HTH domain
MSSVIHIKTNHEVLKWARNSIALSKQKATDDTGISLSRLEKLEAGIKFPTMAELKAMSKTYKRTIATLLLQKPPAEKPLPKDRRIVNSASLDVFHPKTILAVRKARALVNALIELKIETGSPVPQFSNGATLKDSSKEVASALRKAWQMDEYRKIEKTSDALEAYIEHIESLGFAVFQLSLTNDSVRGFSLTDEPVPVIVIKRGKEQASAKIFTLFHELGHILLHEGGICDFSFDPASPSIEKWCNAFAAEMLMPSEVLLNLELVDNYVSRNDKIWTKKDLVEIGNYFHMGPLAILRRLLDHDLTTPDYYKAKHEIWNKPSFGIAKENKGRNMPREMIMERGKNYVNLAFKAFDQNRIDLKDLSDYLGLRISSIPKTRQLLNAS